MQVLKVVMGAVLAFTFSSAALAGEKDFQKGRLISEFGPVAKIDSDVPIPEGTQFKVSYDVAKAADAGELNRTLTTAARFLNMHHAVGIPEQDMSLAVIVHGKASFDMVKNARYGVAFEGVDNANAVLIKALTGKGVRIIVCGQSATYYDIENEDLLPNVEMALSAMTAHALLQQDGYTLNPF